MGVKLICSVAVLLACISGIVCPPVNPNPVEGGSPDEDVGFGLEYDRYLREVVMALEEDESFRKKLEEANITDIKSGKIAMYLEMVSHNVREKLDEIKRTEITRLRNLARKKMQMMNGMQVFQQIANSGGLQNMDSHYPNHVDAENPHSFEMQDLQRLIVKATTDLDEIDLKRKGEFKDYEMRKEHERQETLHDMDDEKRKEEENKFEEMKKKHQDHPKLKHPGSKAQLEEVWEKSDHMDPEDFDPKTFFKMHDIDGNNLLDQDEIEALFQKELDQVYDPNMPEDDMRERYEDMARMREHVFTELDGDKDKLISFDEFLNYTSSNEFEKDEGWQGVDEQKEYTDEEFQRYEQMLKEQQEQWEARNGGRMDPNIQPGMVPMPRDPNVQQMQMPQGQQMQGQGMQLDHQQMQQQQKQFEQQQQQMHQQQQQMHQQQGGEQHQQQGGPIHQQQGGPIHQGQGANIPGGMPGGPGMHAGQGMGGPGMGGQGLGGPGMGGQGLGGPGMGGPGMGGQGLGGPGMGGPGMEGMHGDKAMGGHGMGGPGLPGGMQGDPGMQGGMPGGPGMQEGMQGGPGMPRGQGQKLKFKPDAGEVPPHQQQEQKPMV